MSFSNPFAISNSNCSFSPDGLYVGYTTQHKIIVRCVTRPAYEQIYTFCCLDIIQSFHWSPDAKYILCVLAKRSTVQVFSLQSPSWRCKIQESESGITDALWSPDSRHIITIAEFHISLSVWSLVGRSISYIHQPKTTVNIHKGYSGDGKWFAVVENHGKLDLISVFCTLSWQLMNQLSCPDIGDIGGLTWSPNSTVFCVWRRGIGQTECRLSFYSVVNNKWFAFYRPENYEKPLGVRRVSFSPSGQFLALGSYDSTVRILHFVTWQKLSEVKHEMVLSKIDCKIFNEIRDQKVLDCEELDDDAERGDHPDVPTNTIFEEVEERPVVVSKLSDPTKDNISSRGTSLVSFSSCGTYLATKVDTYPAALWIWNMESFKLTAVLVHRNPVTSATWDPSKPLISITTGSNTVSFWSPEEATVVTVPRLCLGQTMISSALWHPAGEMLALCANNKMTILEFCKR